jgi:hypothetical protein
MISIFVVVFFYKKEIMASNLCLYCKHAYSNNRDLKEDGFKGNSNACRAYPEEIPYNYPKGGHEKIQPNQVGNFVYEKVDDELFMIADTDEVLSDIRFAEFGHS